MVKSNAPASDWGLPLSNCNDYTGTEIGGGGEGGWWWGGSLEAAYEVKKKKSHKPTALN